MTLDQLGFSYTGRCACPGKPEKWVHGRNLQLKKWPSGNWKLFRSGYLVRYGSSELGIVDEVNEYMTTNNII